VAGAVGAAAMLAFYVLVVAGASGSWDHFGDQARADWYLITLVVLGFGAQVAVISELRRRRRLLSAAAAAGTAGAGASAVGMIACCAHHIAELLPFLGLTGAATFLYDYKVAFVVVGVGVNVVALTIGLRRLRSTPVPVVPKHAGEQVAV
jgi:hypothetical protein